MHKFKGICDVMIWWHLALKGELNGMSDWSFLCPTIIMSYFIVGFLALFFVFYVFFIKSLMSIENEKHTGKI